MTNQEYIRYIEHTGQVPLSVAKFDEDWEPIGPNIRANLILNNLITIEDGGIRLVTPTE